MSNVPMTEVDAAQRLAALGNETRIRLFRALVRAGRPGLTVGELQRRLQVPASTMAHHVGALVRADLVLQERVGREVVCRAGFDAVNGLVAYLTEACCAEELGAKIDEKPNVVAGDHAPAGGGEGVRS